MRGACTQSSTAKLKLSREDRGIEVEFEVDQNRNGVPWKVTLRRNGALVASATARTRGPSGSFEFRRVVSGVGNDRRRRHAGLRRALHRPRRDLIAGVAPAWWTVSLNVPRPFIRRGYNRRPALLAQLVEHLHGKEGVDGSSPSEGFRKRPAYRGSLLSVTTLACRT